MSETNKIIITCAICFSFVVNSIMVGWKQTRRSADDEVKINSAKDSNSELIDDCYANNGFPKLDYKGAFKECNLKS